jgi:hypothetical protein
MIKNLDATNTSGTLDYLKCRICRRQFDDLGEMQIHTLIEHIQKGNIPKE